MYRKNILAALLAGLLALGAVACEVEDEPIDDPLEEEGLEDDGLDDDM